MRYPEALPVTSARNELPVATLSKKLELSNEYDPEASAVVEMLKKNASESVRATVAPGIGAPVAWLERMPLRTVPPGFSVMFAVSGGEPETVNGVWATQYPFAHADRSPVLKLYWLEFTQYRPDESAVTVNCVETLATYTVAPAMGRPLERSEITP